jgi:hypothetical protein
MNGCMAGRIKLASLSLLLLVGLGGCRGPTGLFSCLDRHCFVADWMNDHSCVSCRYCANSGSQATLPLDEQPLDLSSDTDHAVQ